MGKFVDDLLKTGKKWSFKRVTALYTLQVAIVYAFAPLIYPDFKVLEFVMMSLVGYSAGMLGMTVWQKNTERNNTSEDDSLFCEEDRERRY